MTQTVAPAAGADLEIALKQALETPWANQLISALELIHLLGVCTAMTTKSEFSSLELQDAFLE